jgi:hypothetical protein
MPPARFSAVARSRADLWAIGAADPNTAAGRCHFPTIQLGLAGPDFAVPNQVHRDFEREA